MAAADLGTASHCGGIRHNARMKLGLPRAKLAGGVVVAQMFKGPAIATNIMLRHNLRYMIL